MINVIKETDYFFIYTLAKVQARDNFVRGHFSKIYISNCLKINFFNTLLIFYIRDLTRINGLIYKIDFLFIQILLVI